MIDDQLIRDALNDKPDGWVDTIEQAQLRACLISVLEGHDEAKTIKVCFEIITLMRDQLLAGTAQIRRAAAKEARRTMSIKDIVDASGQSPQTVARLLDEAKRN